MMLLFISSFYQHSKKVLALVLLAGVAMSRAYGTNKYIAQATQHDINFSGLTITCTIYANGTNSCMSNAGFVKNSAVQWQGAIPPTAKYQTLINVANAHNLIVATWSNNNHFSSSKQGLSLYLGRGPDYTLSGNRTDHFDFYIDQTKTPSQTISLSGNNTDNLQLTINPAGSAIYAQTEAATRGCSWGGWLQMKQVNPNKERDSDSYLFLTTDNERPQSVHFAGTIFLQDAIINVGACRLLMYTDGEYFALSPSSGENLKNYYAGYYSYNHPIIFTKKLFIKNATYKVYSRTYGPSSSSPYKITINKVTLHITANHYLDTPAIKLANGGNSVSKTITYNAQSQQFDKPTIQVDIRPGQNSRGIDRSFGLTWTTPGGKVIPTFTDNKRQVFPIEASFYPQPNEQGTPVTLSTTPPSSSANAMVLESCNTLSNGYCPAPYTVQFSIPTRTHKPGGGVYSAQGQLTIWGDFNPG